MRISELALRSGVSVSTIKFYLREQLLPEGILTSKTQAQYDETHVSRMRLVRALIGPGGLSVAAARRVLEAIDDPPDSMHDLLGVATAALRRTEAADDQDHERVHVLMRRWGWIVDQKDCATSHAALAEALAAFESADFELPDELLTAYQQAMGSLAQLELESVPTESAAAAVRYVVLGTVLIEPVLLALRRMAEAEYSARRFGAEAERAAPAPV